MKVGFTLIQGACVILSEIIQQKIAAEQQPPPHAYTHKQNQTVPAVQPSSSTSSFNVPKVKGENIPTIDFMRHVAS